MDETRTLAKDEFVDRDGRDWLILEMGDKKVTIDISQSGRFISPGLIGQGLWRSTKTTG